MATLVRERQLLTLREAAELLRISERQVRRLIASGSFPAYRLGGPGASIRIDRGELEAWLDAPPPKAAA